MKRFLKCCLYYATCIKTYIMMSLFVIKQVYSKVAKGLRLETGHDWAIFIYHNTFHKLNLLRQEIENLSSKPWHPLHYTGTHAKYFIRTQIKNIYPRQLVSIISIFSLLLILY